LAKLVIHKLTPAIFFRKWGLAKKKPGLITFFRQSIPVERPKRRLEGANRGTAKKRKKRFSCVFSCFFVPTVAPKRPYGPEQRQRQRDLPTVRPKRRMHILQLPNLKKPYLRAR
jgi:hypothetical protein